MSTTLSLMDGATVVAQQIQVDPITPPGANGFLRLLGWARWIFTLGGILALFVAGLKFGFERWSHGAVESPKMVVGVVVGCVLVAAAPQIVYAAMAA